MPLEAIQTEADKSFVYKKTLKGFEKVIVETGESNNDYVIIIKGLEKGDKVALSNPFATDDKKDKKQENLTTDEK